MRKALPALLATGLLGAPAAPPPSRPPAQPAPAPPQDPLQVRRRLVEVQGRLGQVDRQLEALKKRRRGVLVELQGLSLQAQRVRAQVDGARLRRDQTQAEVGEITARREMIRQDIARLRTALRRQIRWTQALGPLGDASFLMSVSGFRDFLVQGRYLAWWQGQERQRLELIQHLQGDLLKREAELKEALGQLAREEREALDLQSGLSLHEERLRTFLEGLGQDESRQRELQAELGEEAIQLERMLGNLLGKPRTDAFEAPEAFAGLRGELPQPVAGTLAQAFGEHLHPRFRTKTVQSGILVASERGAPVAAVAEGRAVFVDSYQSYGPMVILDHGGGWFTLYTRLGSTRVAKGQVVRAGEVLGSVGDGPEGPRLGFEVRHLTVPQDPQKWLRQRYR